MAVAILFTASCAKEDISSSIGGGEVEVTFSASLPELGTRAYADGANAGILYYNVYDAATNELLEDISGYKTGSKVFTVNIPMLKGMTYDIVFWAQKEGNDYYSLIGKELTVKFDANKKNANDNDRDAFYAYVDGFNPATAQNEDTQISLYRPFGQLNAATSDYDNVKNNGVKLTTSSLKVTTFSKLNLETGVATDPVEVTFDATAMPCTLTPDKETLKSGYEYLSMNYLLPGTVDAEYTFKGKRSDNSEVVFTGTTYTNVPVKANYRTNILGKLLTASTEFTVTIEKDFDEPDVEVWNGESVAKPEYDENTKTYTVSNAAEFAWISALTNGTLPASSRTEYAAAEKIDNHTILLDGDLDFGGKTLAPINNVNGLTFDGQGHTIYNISYGMGKNYSTMFEIASNTVVKDVYFEGVAVNATGTGRGATLIGYYTGGTVENVHVKDVIVKGFQKLSGLVAYVTQDGGVDVTIKDCSVEDITIAASDAGKVYQAGGLVGYISSSIDAKLTFENCEVKGNIAINDTPELEGDDCFGFYSGGFIGSISQKSGVDEGITININNCKVGTVTATPALSVSPRGHELFADCSNGSIAGRIANNIYIDGNKYVCNGVTKDQNGDYYLSNAAGLFWLAGEVNKYYNYERPFEGVTVYLTTDINLQGAEWIPIGDYRFSANRFCGTFDGQNHTISNFKISKDTDKDDAKKSSYGFFGNVEGTIKNLTIDDASVNAYAYTAILVGRLTNGTLENCHVKNSSVVNSFWQAGGLVGQQNEVCNIKNCSVDNVTVQSKSCVGLLVGPMTNEEKDPATVSAIENCSVKNSKIIQRGSHGSAYDKLFGVINADVDFSNNTLNINNFTSENNSFDRNGVDADLALYAGLQGNVFIDGVCVSAYGLTIVDGYAALFKNDEGDYCLLNKQSLIDWHNFLDANKARNPYACNVKMLANIDAEGWTWNSLWITPDSGDTTGFQFDGQDHTISNLKIAGEGLVTGALKGMAFKNLTIDGVEVESDGHNAAVFAGSTYSNVSFENVAVKNATVNGLCNTGIFVGGTYEPNNLVISFKNCSVETSAVTAAGKNDQDPTGASGFVGKAYSSTKLVFEGTNSIDDATTITNHNGLVGGKAYGYTIWANGGWANTGASDELVSWGGLSYVSDAAALTEALTNGGIVVLSDDVVAEAATTAPYGNKYGFKLDGGVLDGNDHELKVECYGDHYGIMTSGGTVKNLTIKEGCRAIMIMSPTEDIILDNVNFGGDGVLYPINTGEAGAEGIKLVVTNSTLAGWVSFSNIASASFTNVEFKQGTYYNDVTGRVLRPYVNTTITDCSFVAHMNLDLYYLTSGHKITFKNCTVDGQAINAGVFTVPTTDAQYDTELFTVDLPAWASSINDCIVFE